MCHGRATGPSRKVLEKAMPFGVVTAGHGGSRFRRDRRGPVPAGVRWPAASSMGWPSAPIARRDPRRGGGEGDGGGAVVQRDDEGGGRCGAPRSMLTTVPPVGCLACGPAKREG